MQKFNPKQMLVVDMGSGSYLYDKIGHEIFNLERNLIDGNFYGYCPPWGNINIFSLGAKENDKFIDDVLVVFVSKAAHGNNREIIGFYPSARAFGENQPGDGLSRVIRDEDGEEKIASFQVKSDTLYDLRKRSKKFTIRVEGNTAYMFRKQRFYGGTYPELDKEIIAYLENILNDIELIDDFEEQYDIQESEGLPNDEREGTADKPLAIIISGHGKSIRKNSRISKEALINANYKCLINPAHETFSTTRNVPYMEGHHLIPCTVFNAKTMWEKTKKNIDCLENIVCLCPTCHRAVHFGNKETVKDIVNNLYSKQGETLKKTGIIITLDELLLLYKK